MRPLSIAVLLASLALPAMAIAGPEGTFHVKGVNPDGGDEYAGTVKVTRQGDVYRVVWDIAGDQTVGIGLGIRIVNGQILAGPASDRDTGISVSYTSNETPGNATYSEFSDGTWRGVWAYVDDKTPSIEEWIPTASKVATKSVTSAEDKANQGQPTGEREDAKVDAVKASDLPTRVMPSPLPANASPKS